MLSSSQIIFVPLLITHVADISEDLPSLDAGLSIDVALEPLVHTVSPISSNKSSGISRKRRAEHDISDDEADALRKEKNRLAARRHRMARKNKDHEAEEHLQHLNERNRYLKSLVAQTSLEVQTIKRAVLNMIKQRKLTGKTQLHASALPAYTTTNIATAIVV